METRNPISRRSLHPRHRQRTVLLLGALVTVLLGGTAGAHPGRVSFSRIWLEDDQIHQSIKILTDELGEALPLDRNSNQLIDAEEIQAQRPLVESYLAEKLIVENNGTRLQLKVDSLEVRLEEVVDSEPKFFLLAEVRFLSEQPLQELRLHSRILEDVDQRHDNFAKLEFNGQIRPYVFTPHNEYRVLLAQQDVRSQAKAEEGFSWASAWSFLGHGIGHIFQGYDHMLFLIGLLLVATSFLSTLKIVTAFTIGHSISLTLAALQIVQFNRGLLESLIALTIVYVALENIFAKSSAKRWVVSLLFGLVHGLAFAETLQLMGLPTVELVTALFSFNVGIEIAQVIVAGFTIPLILAMARQSWRLQAVQAISLLILGFASFWFVQRAAGLFS